MVDYNLPGCKNQVESLVDTCACVCQSLQSCLSLCNPMNCSLPGSSVHGSLQARILEQVAVSSSRGSFLTQRPSQPLLSPLHWQTGSSPLCQPESQGALPRKIFNDKPPDLQHCLGCLVTGISKHTHVLPRSKPPQRSQVLRMNSGLPAVVQPAMWGLPLAVSTSDPAPLAHSAAAPAAASLRGPTDLDASNLFPPQGLFPWCSRC